MAATNVILHAASTILHTRDIQAFHQESEEWQTRVTKIKNKLLGIHKKIITQLAKTQRKDRIIQLREIFKRVDGDLKNDIKYLKRHIKFHRQDLNHIQNENWSYDEYKVMTNHQSLKTKFNYLSLKSKTIQQEFLQFSSN